YIVTVTDAMGCVATSPVTITQPNILTGTISTQNVSCFGLDNGSATVNAAGGTMPYTYSWNTTPTQTTATAGNLAAGSYSITVTDTNGCTSIASANITAPAALNTSLSANNVSCHGGNNGSATVSVTGGTLPYLYSWNTSPVITTATPSGLTAGTYTVTVTDNNGCMDTAMIAVS